MTTPEPRKPEQTASHAPSAPGTETPAVSPVEPTRAPDEWVVVGVVVGAFGIRGDVKVQPLTNVPDRFERTSTLYLGDQHTAHAVTAVRSHGRLFVLHLTGIETVVAAERLRGVQLFIPASALAPLPADHYYLHDLVGLRVEHVNGEHLGVISDVVSSAANDLFVVRAARTGDEVLLPAVKEFVKSVDIAAGVVRVAPIPGLFDDDALISDEGADQQDAADDKTD